MATDTRERMLEVAGDLLQERGIHGVSIGDILKRSGAPRGSMYFHFPGGKEELVREAMTRRARFVEGVLEDCFREAGDPAEAVRRYVEIAAAGLRDSDFRLGCPIAPIVFDSPEKTSALARDVEETVQSWLCAYVRGFTAAGMESDRAEALAILILSALEGALLVARARRDITPLEAIATELAAMVRNALPGRCRD
jgi:TetR/AcrR family transcriptional repressor of lmrAB and yxaGH operons